VIERSVLERTRPATPMPAVAAVGALVLVTGAGTPTAKAVRPTRGPSRREAIVKLTDTLVVVLGVAGVLGFLMLTVWESVAS